MLHVCLVSVVAHPNLPATLDVNNKLYNEFGNKRIGDNALVAITIMIAESKSDEKEMMIKLVVNLINNNN